MAKQAITLTKVFSAVAKTLKDNQETLNASDDYNHNHGTNMTKTFQVIKKAVAEKADAPVAKQLQYAGELLGKQASGSSAKFYAEGLARAGKSFVGKDLNAETLPLLINTLMGINKESDKASDELKQDNSGDVLSGLLGGLASLGNQSSNPAAEGASVNSLLGGLLSGLGAENIGKDDKLGVDDLLSAGLSFYSAKQGGKSNLDAVMQSLNKLSPLGQRKDQTQSGALIIDTILGLFVAK